MHRYLLISGGVVVNAVEYTPESASAMQGYDAIIQSDIGGPGWGWSQENGLTPPMAQEAVDYGAKISVRDFLRRFAIAERIAIREARRTDMVVEDFMSLMEADGTVRPKHPDTLAGIGYLVQQGLLTQERSTIIMDW